MRPDDECTCEPGRTCTPCAADTYAEQHGLPLTTGLMECPDCGWISRPCEDGTCEKCAAVLLPDLAEAVA